jgi:histidyl-tRNA synthetase
VSEKKEFRAIKGTRDILPPGSYLWNTVEQTARDVFSTYGFGEIRLPIFEEASLFARSIGVETDVVSKEMYTFEDKPSGLPPMSADMIPEDYTAAIEHALKSNQIPRTATNQITLDNLKYHLLDIERARGSSDFEGESKAFQQWLVAAHNLQLGELLTLRPEATASVARAFIEHGMHTWPQPVKLYYIGPMFRRERPQKGRYRQFYQIGAEVLGKADEIMVDSDLIEMLIGFFDRLGPLQTTLYINSIGDKSCRPQYIELLRAALREVQDHLGPDSQRRIETNPLRVLDSKVPHEQEIIERLPRISDYLCEDCREQFAGLKEQLGRRGIAYQENWRLVRGLDYYTRTTFEITAGGLGSQNAVCGGGRYDGLVELLGGHQAPGVGFAIGTDRLILALDNLKVRSQIETKDSVPNLSVAMQRPDALITGTSEESWDEATKLAGSLRKYGLSIYLPKAGTRLPRVLETAHKMRSPVVIIVGEDERGANQYAVRVLKSFTEDGKRDVPVGRDQVYVYGKIVKLRQDLERALARLAAGRPEFDEQRSVSHVVDRLTRAGVLPVRMAGAIKDVMPTLNQAIHGGHLAENSMEWALAYGNLLLNELEKLTPSEGESLA